MLPRFRLILVATAAALASAPLRADLNSDLHAAVKAGDADRVKALLDGGANVNSRNALGAAPLHEAASES